MYAAALERAPNDTVLIGNYAQFLDGMGMIDEAIEQAKRYSNLLPEAWTQYYVAALLEKAGRLNEAEQCLEKALDMDKDIPQAQELLREIKSRK